MNKMIINSIVWMLSIGFIYTQHTSYILCEGNFSGANASLWIVEEDGNLTQGQNNPVGDTGQSITVDGNQLYIINNGSNSIEVYEISEDGTLIHFQSIDTNYSGPREMVVLNGIGYITEWTTETIAVLDLETLQFFEPISVTGMPEDIITDGTYLYTSIIQNSDWSAGNKILKIDPTLNEIVDRFTVGDGPGQMLIHHNFIFVTNVYYDGYWNTYSGASKISLETGDVISNDYGLSLSFNADLVIINDYVYRMWNGGVVRLDHFLNMVDGSQIGDYTDVYSAGVFNNKLYLGLSDYSAPDDVIVLDFNGNELETYEVGAIPGSFAFYEAQVNIENKLVILDYELMSAYPNPFNLKTTIRYQLPTPSSVLLTIYNIDGQSVEQLVQSNNKFEAGSYEVLWDATNYPSGFYFVNLQTADLVLTQKLILLK